MTYRLVDDIASYPCGNDDIKFVVDDFKRCARVKAALSDASNVFAYEGQLTRAAWALGTDQVDAIEAWRPVY